MAAIATIVMASPNSAVDFPVSSANMFFTNPMHPLKKPPEGDYLRRFFLLFLSG